MGLWLKNSKASIEIHDSENFWLELSQVKDPGTTQLKQLDNGHTNPTTKSIYPRRCLLFVHKALQSQCPVSSPRHVGVNMSKQNKRVRSS